MATLSVSGDAYVGYTLTYTGFEDHIIANQDYLIITRSDDSGRYEDVVVRGADSTTVTSYSMAFYDYEAHFNYTPTYTAVRYNTSDVAVETDIAAGTVTTTPSGFAMIHRVLTPAQRSAGAVLKLDGASRETRILGEHPVIGRRNPVVTTDVLGGRTGSMTLSNINLWTVNWDGLGPYTAYAVQDEYLETMFDDGGVFLFRNDRLLTGFDDCYIVVKSVSDARISGYAGAVPLAIKQYDLDFVEVDRPDPGVSSDPLITWADVASARATWTAVASANSTWEDVLESP